MSATSQLLALIKPFAKRLIHVKPGGGGGDYVSHDVVTQKLLAVVGPFDWAIREVTGTNPKSETGEQCIVAVIGTLTCEVDGRRTTVQGAGDAIGGGNWKHDGERIKDGESDALKRAAMRLGVGLHLWSQDEFFLYDFLLSEASPVAGGSPEPSATGDDPGRPFTEGES